jgi:hypothetical protein
MRCFCYLRFCSLIVHGFFSIFNFVKIVCYRSFPRETTSWNWGGTLSNKEEIENAMFLLFTIL